ncbi:MAG: AMP-binding protein [Synechococcus lacustris]
MGTKASGEMWQLLSSPQERGAGEQALAACQELPAGPGLVIGSGGSSGGGSSGAGSDESKSGRRWCLQPWSHLEAAAASCGAWLSSIGLDPERVAVVNPLPGHHMGGLMPQVRARAWGVPLLELSPEQLKQPAELLEHQASSGELQGRESLLSLVPTQLQRLLADPSGVAWLQGFALIWVGGAGLSPALAEQARQRQLRLAPCYGATETAAMVTALDPAAFLAGTNGCGHPLADVSLRIDPSHQAIQVLCQRLSPGWLAGPQVQPFADASGWWSSGDAGSLGPAGLQVLGRLDGALNSGGATVFPEQIEAALAQTPGVAALLVLGLPDPEWGQRLVALVRPSSAADGPAAVANLRARAAALPPAERPKTWLLFPELAPNAQGKWERQRWQTWALSTQGLHPRGHG